MQGALGDSQPGTGVCQLVVVYRRVTGLTSSRLGSPRFPVIVALFLEAASHHHHHCRRLVHEIYNYHDRPKDPQTPRLELPRVLQVVSLPGEIPLHEPLTDLVRV